jgi:phage-related tail fiber protein
MTGQKISNLADGTAAGDAVTKAQLDAIARGLDWKNSVKVATTAAITLSATQTIDGVAVVAGDRVLVKDQASAPANGIYIVAAGAWSRATDFDDAVEVTAAAAIPVESGTTNGDKVFILTTDGAITIGTSNLTFTVLGGAGSSYVAGNGLDLTGSTFDLDIRSTRGLTITAGELDIDVPTLKSILGIVGSYAVDVPTSATATITHNLGSKDVHVTVFEISSGNEVDVDVQHTSTTVVTLNFATAPTTGQYRVVVTG